jgi:hypothetical protein
LLKDTRNCSLPRVSRNLLVSRCGTRARVHSRSTEDSLSRNLLVALRCPYSTQQQSTEDRRLARVRRWLSRVRGSLPEVHAAASRVLRRAWRPSMEGTAPLVVSTASHGPARFSTRRGSRSNGGALEDARAARRAVAVGRPRSLRLDLRCYGSGRASASVAVGRRGRRVRARRRFAVYPGEFISSVLACIARHPTYAVVVRCPCPYRHVRIVHRIPKSDKSALYRASNRAPCLSPHECFLNSADPLFIRPSSNNVGLLCSCPSTAAPMPLLSPNPLI